MKQVSVPAGEHRQATDEQIRDQREAQRFARPHWPFAPLDPMQARYARQQAAWLRGTPGRCGG